MSLWEERELTFRTIDLFSLYVLFFRLRPRDGTPENCFLHMSCYAVAYLSIIYEKTISLDKCSGALSACLHGGGGPHVGEVTPLST